MPQLNLVLVEPRIPQNTGNIARTCAATGARLHLVEPLGFSIDSAKLRRAGLDYWDYLDITRYPSLEDFLDRARGRNSSSSPPRGGRSTPRHAIPTPPGWCSAGRTPGCRRNCCSAGRTAACGCPCGRGCGA